MQSDHYSNHPPSKSLVIGSAYYIFNKQKTRHVLLAGDFNSSGMQWNDDPLDPNIRDTCPNTIKDRFSTITSCFGHIRHQTTITRPDSSSCLDMVFTNHQSLITNVHTSPGMSDHLAVKYDMALKFSQSSTPTRKIYDHRKANITKMTKEMETFTTKFEQDWKNFSPQENWNRFHSALNSIMPLKSLRSQRHLQWINGSVRKSIARHDCLFKKARQSRSPRQWEAYKSHCNTATSAIKGAHNRYVQNIMGDLDQDDPNSQEGGIKRFWAMSNRPEKTMLASQRPTLLTAQYRLTKAKPIPSMTSSTTPSPQRTSTPF